MTKKGFKKLRKLGSDAAARQARKQGKDVLAPNKQAAKAIERSVSDGTMDVIRHKGHDLDDGVKGMPHYQTPGKAGHTFWGGALIFFEDLLDPLGDFEGELAGPEDTMLFDPETGEPYGKDLFETSPCDKR